MTSPNSSVETQSEILAQTESVCPECLQRIPALRVLRGENVYLEKACPEHGFFRTVVWRGEPGLKKWVRPKKPAAPLNPFTQVQQGCPYDCGLCPDHQAHTCCILFEVTQRCDLRCPVCFANVGHQIPYDPDLSTLEQWFKRLLEAGGPYNIQLSGGEPCMRNDLPEIIKIGRSLGFTYFQLNTNGLRIARDEKYLEALVQAGLKAVFLQFDGTEDSIYQQLRGRKLLEEKIKAIQHCASQDVGCVLVPTLVPGVNSENLGKIIELALHYHPSVRGVHIQPISYFGRYSDIVGISPSNMKHASKPTDISDSQRITIPEVIRAIEEQTQGSIKSENFRPPGAENAMCSFHGNFIRMPDGELRSLTHHNPTSSCCCKTEDAAEGVVRLRSFVARQWSYPKTNLQLPITESPSLGEWDILLERSITHSFCISGMAFQDAWNLDLERLRGCCVHTISADGRIVPFCAYNLTDRSGRSLYRNNFPNQSHSKMIV
jgi:7,8-dihydro-6-hydroxymethylpterin dimethyltransferase